MKIFSVSHQGESFVTLLTELGDPILAKIKDKYVETFHKVSANLSASCLSTCFIEVAADLSSLFIQRRSNLIHMGHKSWLSIQ
jgi:hypothetical protein